MKKGRSVVAQADQKRDARFKSLVHGEFKMRLYPSKDFSLSAFDVPRVRAALMRNVAGGILVAAILGPVLADAASISAGPFFILNSPAAPPGIAPVLVQNASSFPAAFGIDGRPALTIAPGRGRFYDLRHGQHLLVCTLKGGAKCDGIADSLTVASDDQLVLKVAGPALDLKTALTLYPDKVLLSYKQIHAPLWDSKCQHYYSTFPANGGFSPDASETVVLLDHIPHAALFENECPFHQYISVRYRQESLLIPALSVDFQYRATLRDKPVPLKITDEF